MLSLAYPEDRQSLVMGTGRGLSAYSAHDSQCTSAIDHLSLVRTRHEHHKDCVKGEYVPKLISRRFELAAHHAPWDSIDKGVCLVEQRPLPY